MNRFLNVEYSVYKTRINVTGMGELSDVRRAIKAEFGEAIPVAPALIQLYFNSTREQLITDLDEITPENTPQYYQKLTQGGTCVFTPPSKQGSQVDLVLGTTFFDKLTMFPETVVLSDYTLLNFKRTLLCK